MTLQPSGDSERDSKQSLELLRVDGLFGIETRPGLLIEVQLVSVTKPTAITHSTWLVKKTLISITWPTSKTPMVY